MTFSSFWCLFPEIFYCSSKTHKELVHKILYLINSYLVIFEALILARAFIYMYVPISTL